MTTIHTPDGQPISTSNPLPVREYAATDVQDDAGHSLTASGYTTKSFSILGSDSLSGEIDLEGYNLVAIVIGPGLDGTSLTFQASATTGGTFFNVYDSAGNELTATARSSVIITDLPELAPLRFIKIRSGTSGTPVTQSDTLSLTLIVKG